MLRGLTAVIVLLFCIGCLVRAGPAEANNGPDLVGTRAIMLLGQENAPGLATKILDLSPAEYEPAPPTSFHALWENMRNTAQIDLITSRTLGHSDTELGISGAVADEALGLVDVGLLITPSPESGDVVRLYLSRAVYELLMLGDGVLRFQLQPTGHDKQIGVQVDWTF
jgi:hypothetical protein